MSNPCVILCINDVATWEDVLGGGKRIPVDNRSTTLQPSREVAEEEAKRLAKLRPDHQFAVFEVQAVAKTLDLPSHITLGGKVFAQRREARLFLVGEEADEVPF